MSAGATSSGEEVIQSPDGVWSCPPTIFEEIDSHPGPRAAHSCALIDQKLYIFGGTDRLLHVFCILSLPPLHGFSYSEKCLHISHFLFFLRSLYFLPLLLLLSLVLFLLSMTFSLLRLFLLNTLFIISMFFVVFLFLFFPSGLSRGRSVIEVV